MVEHRKTKSQDKIKTAVIELLAKKDFSDITVSDITRKAGINRGTFYLHYLDKEDLAQSISDEVTQRFTAILDRKKLLTADRIVEALYDIKAERVFFKTISQISFVNFPKKVRDFYDT